jgi:2'-5' RNA ligase
MYYIAVILPAHLNEKVLRLKQYMLDHYHCKVGLKSPAHITIAPPFWMEAEKENDLKNDINVLSGSMQNFLLSTNNFSAFKPRTIFIAIHQSDALNGVKQNWDTYFKNKEYGMKQENRPFHPHITIATRDLFKKDFADAWPFFENKEFKEEWMVEGLSLLRHNKKNWDVIHTSQLNKI